MRPKFHDPSGGLKAANAFDHRARTRVAIRFGRIVINYENDFAVPRPIPGAHDVEPVREIFATQDLAPTRGDSLQIQNLMRLDPLRSVRAVRYAFEMVNGRSWNVIDL